MIRRFKRGVATAEFHILESLDNKWHAQHVKLIADYLNVILKVPSENLDHKMDTQDILLPLPLE